MKDICPYCNSSQFCGKDLAIKQTISSRGKLAANLMLTDGPVGMIYADGWAADGYFGE